MSLAMDKAGQQLETYLRKHNLKLTRQRQIILQELMHSGRHLTAEELHRLLPDRSIGLATVYRTLNLLTESGLAQRRRFGDGQTRFEHLLDESHHDHLVCTNCGQIVEFKNDDIERLQLEVAERHGYQITDHRMVLYGLCPGCRRRGRNVVQRPALD